MNGFFSRIVSRMVEPVVERVLTHRLSIMQSSVTLAGDVSGVALQEAKRAAASIQSFQHRVEVTVAKDVARNISASDVADYIHVKDVAEYVELDYSEINVSAKDVAEELDLSDLAEHIDMEKLATAVLKVAARSIR
jgi:hypothetical protein